MKYHKVTDGEVVRPRMRGYRMMCCDCSLVHVINFRVVRCGRGHKVEFTASRNNRSTAAARRGKAGIKFVRPKK